MPEVVQIDPQRLEGLGPAERVIQAVSGLTDHLVHNRPGIVVKDARTNIGVRWSQATWRKQEDGSKHVFRCDLTKTGVGKKQKTTTNEVLLGTLAPDGKRVLDARGTVVAEWREPGIYVEVAEYLYRQVAEVYKTDADFSAHWASWAFTQDRRDLQTILAAFMLTQKHAGEPVTENGQVLFYDDDFRAVGEAMVLHRQKGSDLSPKQVLLIGQILRLPEIHAINRELGFSQSARNPQIRRYKKAVQKWLRYREDNPRMLAGLVKAGWGNTVEQLARSVRYKAQSPEFFKALRWKQSQAKDGHRTIALDMELEEKVTWKGLTEGEVCERIVAEQPSWLNLVGQLPEGVGLTPAIFVAAVEAGCVSDKQILTLVPTIEDLGVGAIPSVAQKLARGVKNATDQRSRHTMRNVKTDAMRDILEEAADVATAKAIEKVTRNLRVYFIIDKSGSMDGAIEAAKRCLSKFVGGFPLDRTHVSIFNTMGTEIKIQAARSAAVEHALSKHTASGGTRYGEGVRAIQHHKPQEDEDSLFIFIGDGCGESGLQLATAIEASGLRPVSFIWGQFTGNGRWGNGNLGRTVTDAAARLQIPCASRTAQDFEDIFEDPYAVSQVLANLIAATPVGEAPAQRRVVRRVSLVEQILRTPLLERPAWAA